MKHDRECKSFTACKATMLTAMVAASAGFSLQPLAQEIRAGIEEVTVTARKREESSTDIPIAITAIGENAIAAKGATAMSDLVGGVPNLALDPNGNSLNSWGMRGIVSVTRNAGQESGMGVYIDGVYAGRPASFNFPLNDIQQVEVLRGPQGSLFGRNTIAGAINITTREPGEELEGEVKASLGNYNRQDLQARIAGRLVDGVLAGKMSAFSFQRDGYIDNLYDGKDYMNDNRQGGRGALYWTPSDALEVTLSADFLEQENRTLFGQVAEPGVNAFIPGWYQDDPFTVNANDPNSEAIESGGASMRAVWDMESGFTFTSITAQRYADFELRVDDDMGPETLSYAYFQDNSETFSQEFQLASPANDQYDYLVGFYYLDQEVNADRLGSVVPYPVEGLGIINSADVLTESWAVFSTANVYLTDALRASVGLRYTEEEKRADYSQLDTVGFGFPIVNFAPGQKDGAVSGDLSLSYALNDAVNLYGSVRTGVKSGGFQTDIIDFADPSLFSFGPESAISYEAGVKGMLLDRTLKVDAAVFRTDYDDMQVGQLLGLGFTTTNAGESVINGLELDVTWLPTDSLELGMSLGLLDHEYSSYEGCNGPAVSCDGNALQLVSDWTASAYANYDYPLASGASLVFRADWSKRDGYFNDALNDPDTYVEARALLNGRMGYESADGAFSAYVWAKNLLDEEYNSLLWKYPLTPLFFPGTTGQMNLYGEPRTLGFDATYRF
ncbi:Pesticin receptor precursor [Microbulbifer aggregans]|uniref:Pesticin receptor n=1 Tax=Microbulbifer aggregans TaxID=1769779 RepID=A0A1C9W4B7_9GAMM|nr:TonB-dependent receptor [Microbulbifer aggregans]AOS95999.1 Pesticin receptor precursor [Microbulbifer aggregans]